VSVRLLKTFESAVGGLPRAYWYLWGGTLINKMGGFVLPFLAVYLTATVKLPVEQAGLIVALFGAGSMVASPLGGVLADRIGRRTTMVLGLSSGAVSMLALGFAHTPLTIGAATLALGVTGDLYRPASQAMIADIVQPADRMRAFSLMYWSINLGFSIAPVIAGFMASRSYLALFVGDAITSLAYAGIVLLKVPESKPSAPPEGKRTTELAGFLAPFKDRVFLPFLALTFGVSVIFMQFSVTLPIELTHNKVTPSEYGFILAVNGVLIIVIQPFTTRWLAPYRRSGVLAAAALFTGFGFGFNALVHTVPLYALSVAIWTMGEIIMSPVNASVVADLAPVHLRGRYQGAFALSWSLSHFLAPIIGGLVMGTLGGSWLWGGCAALGILVATAHFGIAGSRQRRMVELLGVKARAVE
jgi:MFS family permease